MSTTAFSHSSAGSHVAQMQQPAAKRTNAGVTPDVRPSENFAVHEVVQFRKDDAEAGHNICRIVCALFSVSVILSGIVCWWTFS